MSFLIASTPRKTPRIGSLAAKGASTCGDFAAATVGVGVSRTAERCPLEPLFLKYTLADSLRMPVVAVCYRRVDRCPLSGNSACNAVSKRACRCFGVLDAGERAGNGGDVIWVGWRGVGRAPERLHRLR